MKPFLLFDFFQNAGKKTALAIGSLLLILGLLVLFFPVLLRTIIGLMLVGGGIPLVIYGWKADTRFTKPQSRSQQSDDDARIIYPE